MTPDGSLLAAFKVGFELVGKERSAKVTKIREVGPLPLAKRIVVFNAVTLDTERKLRFSIPECQCKAQVALTGHRIDLIGLRFSDAPAASWVADGDFGSRHGSVGLASQSTYQRLVTLEENGAFDCSYFDHVIDSNWDYKAGDTRLIHAPPAPPILVFEDQQIGGGALWALDRNGKPAALVLDLFRSNSW